ncbi:hypothetical protein HDU84_003048 [Entophlyctis sp. JEL0112]|nr:hypothetical protein HDU84_003048 [Entophlyctis sp. JEL0112]
MDTAGTRTVARDQIRKAVAALFAFNDKNRTAAAGVDIDPAQAKRFWITITTKKAPLAARVKPHKIPIKHPLNPEQDSQEVCLFVKDPQKDFKALLAEKNITVIGLSKLKSDYYSYEAKRQLCDSYDLFLTDSRIVALLPPLLGKYFFQKKKFVFLCLVWNCADMCIPERQPVPVDMTAKNLSKEITIARSSTYMFFSKGVTTSIKIGTVLQDPEHVVENIYESLDSIVDKIPSKWGNVLRIDLKLCDSVALPLFNSLPVADVEETESVVVTDARANTVVGGLKKKRSAVTSAKKTGGSLRAVKNGKVTKK